MTSPSPGGDQPAACEEGGVPREVREGRAARGAGAVCAEQAAAAGEAAEGSTRRAFGVLVAFFLIASLSALLAVGTGGGVRGGNGEDGRQSVGSSGPNRMSNASHHTRRKLEIENNLGQMLHHMHINPPALHESIGHFATGLFDQVMNESHVHDELTSGEEDAFRQRFVAAVTRNAWNEGVAGFLTGFVESAEGALEAEKPVMTAALAAEINGADLGFTVEMQQWMQDMSNASFQHLLGRASGLDAQSNEEREQHRARSSEAHHDLRGDVTLPSAFDARTGWPECADIIGRVRQQGRCGSCWAFSAITVVESRLCIKTSGNFSGDTASLSRGFATSCATADGCDGGWEFLVFRYLDQQSGIPTSACVPYWEDTAEEIVAPACPSQCTATTAPRPFEEDLYRPRGMGNFKWYPVSEESHFQILRAAIYEQGPVTYGLVAENDLFGYRSGIYTKCADTYANHAVVATGWGPGYYTTLNSWGTRWGDYGFVKVAPCVVKDFTVPGTIWDGTAYPPVPDSAAPRTWCARAFLLALLAASARHW